MKQYTSLILLVWMGTLTHLTHAHGGHDHDLGIVDPGICAINCENEDHHQKPIECVWSVVNQSQRGYMVSENDDFIIQTEFTFAQEYSILHDLSLLVSPHNRAPPLS